MGPNVISTVTTAASSYDLTTLAIVKDELSITNTDSDATLQRYLTNASAAAAQYCNRVFPVEAIKDLFWAQRDRFPRIIPGGMPALKLSRYPITTVDAVIEFGVTLVEDTDFKTDAANGELIRLDVNGYPRLWPIYPIEVDYHAGYSTIPSDVQDAVVRMVKSRWLARGRDPNLKARTIPGVIEQQWWIASGTEQGNMTPDVTDLLDNYRTPVIG